MPTHRPAAAIRMALSIMMPGYCTDHRYRTIGLRDVGATREGREKGWNAVSIRKLCNRLHNSNSNRGLSPITYRNIQ